MSSKISNEVNKNYLGDLSNDELIQKYFYKKDNLGNEYIGLKDFENQNCSELEKQNLIDEFKSLEILKSKNEFGLIDLTIKVKEKFKQDLAINNVFIIEPYTFLNLGKTKFGYNMHKAKGDSDIKIIKNFSEILYKKYLELNNYYSFDYIGIVPPTLKGRKIQIMDFIKNYFLIQNEKLKILDIVKVDGSPSQKSLKKFDDRKENAQNSFLVGNKNENLGNVLLIDDAIGSGTTINYLSEKIEKQNNVDIIVGLAVIGSMRGFDIIKEI